MLILCLSHFITSVLEIYNFPNTSQPTMYGIDLAPSSGRKGSFLWSFSLTSRARNSLLVVVVVSNV